MAETRRQAAPAAPSTAAEIKQAVSDFLGCEPADIADDANLAVLGLASIEVMRLATRWRRAGVQVDMSELMERPTVAAWFELLTERTGGDPLLRGVSLQ